MIDNFDTSHYEGAQAGPNLSITGAIHGNEPCGPVVIGQLLDDIGNGDIGITRGGVSLIPVCNPAAYERGIRYFERNMNRRFHPKDEPATYEDRRINELAPYFEKADYLLDIHSC